MKLKQWVLFLDMLGYRQHNGGINDDKKAIDFIAFMEEVKEVVYKSTDNQILRDGYKGQSFNFYDYYHVEFACISDSILISFVPKEFSWKVSSKQYYMHSANALFLLSMRIMSVIYKCFHEKGIFLRGGVCAGYCKVQGSFAVGEGVGRAYKAESETARYPRIAVDESVFDDAKLMKELRYLCSIMYKDLKLISRGGDGVYYIDWLGLLAAQGNPSSPSVKRAGLEEMQRASLATRDMFEAHQMALAKAVKKFGGSPSKRVREKYDWLVGYHNIKVIYMYGFKSLRRLVYEDVDVKVKPPFKSGFKHICSS